MARTSDDSPRARQRRLDTARREAEACKRCDLWRTATQTVFGEGPVDADVVLVGEQPGDQEDCTGAPFVGPAGAVLQQALAAARLSATVRYVTNAVKHFKWEPRGKRRIHKRPNPAEMRACQFWLELELALVRPRLVVALGATAVSALLGPGARVLRDRGRWFTSPWAGEVLVTVHPSSILRAPDSEAREAAMGAFVKDLRAVRNRLARLEKR